jgi:hypothetical protein
MLCVWETAGPLRPEGALQPRVERKPVASRKVGELGTRSADRVCAWDSGRDRGVPPVRLIHTSYPHRVTASERAAGRAPASYLARALQRHAVALPFASLVHVVQLSSPEEGSHVRL